jgi:tRNA threonylcarbamoyladenosine biosynthesis protein TsaB
VTPNAHPTILAIDTATDVCSVAMAHAGTIVEAVESVGHRHSERVLPMVQSLLAAQGVKLAACDAIAFSAGPGAFTGLRVACAIAQGLACALAKRVVPVGNLEALAYAAMQARPGAARVLTANDARIQQIYWAVYDAGPEGAIERAAPAVADAGELATLLATWSPTAFAGDATSAFPDAPGNAEARALAVIGARASAASIAAIAVERWRRGRTIAPAQAAPLYVRNHDALTIAERAARAAGVAA